MANISAIKVGSTSYGITATPKAHASTATTYGAATASNYGHVKLSDNYISSAGAAASGIGASSAAVYNAYNTLNSEVMKVYNHTSGTFYINIKSPINHIEGGGIYAYNHTPFMASALTAGFGLNSTFICFGCSYGGSRPPSASSYSLKYVGTIASGTASVTYASTSAINYKITATNLILYYQPSHMSISTG